MERYKRRFVLSTLPVAYIHTWSVSSWSGKGKRKSNVSCSHIQGHSYKQLVFLRRRVRFCGHIVRYRFLKERFAFHAVRLNCMFMIIISENLRHDNVTISDMSLVKFSRRKFECVWSDTSRYATACKQLYWSQRLGDVRGTNFQEDTCNCMCWSG